MRVRLFSVAICFLLVAARGEAQQPAASSSRCGRPAPNPIPPLLCTPGTIGWMLDWTLYAFESMTDSCPDNPSVAMGGKASAGGAVGGGHGPGNPTNGGSNSSGGSAPLDSSSSSDTLVLSLKRVIVVLKPGREAEKGQIERDFGLSEREEYRQCVGCPWGETALLLELPDAVGIRVLLDLITQLNNDVRIALAQPDYNYMFLSDDRVRNYTSGDFRLVSRSQVPLAQEETTGAGAVYFLVDSSLDMQHPLVRQRMNIHQDIIISTAPPGTEKQHVLETLSQVIGWGPVIGVAPDAEIQHISVQRGASGRSSSTWMLFRALDKIVQFHNGGHRVDVIALPLGTITASDWLVNMLVETLVTGNVKKIINDQVETITQQHGIPIFAAAGNEGPNQEMYPAALDKVFSVTAVDSNGNVFARAYQGSSIDVAALGVCVDVPKPRSGDSTPIALRECRSGTSIAAVRAAAEFTLLSSQHGPLTPTIVRARLQDSVFDLGEVGWDPVFGQGFFLVKAAVEKMKNNGRYVSYSGQ